MTRKDAGWPKRFFDRAVVRLSMLSAVNLGQSQVAKVSQNSTLGGKLCQPNVKKIQRTFFKGSELYFLTVTFMLIIFWAKSGKVFDKVLSHENLKVSNCLLFSPDF